MRWRAAAPWLALLLAACRSAGPDVHATPSPHPEPTPRPTHAQHLVTAALADPQTFNPLVATDAASRAAVADLFDPLLRLDPRSGEMEPALAESWTLDAAGTTLELRLRDGVRWHDGEPLTAADVVFTFAALADARVPSPYAAALQVDGRPLRAAALDARRVRLRLPRPFAPLPHALAVPIVPRHRLAGALRDGTFAQQWRAGIAPQAVVGSGPYRLAAHDPGHAVRLTRNPDYWMRDDEGRPLPYLDAQTLRIVPDGDAATRAFLAGETDLHAPSAEEVRALLQQQANGAFSVREVGVDPGMLFVAFNRNPARAKHNGIADPRHEWFADPQFRRALAHAVDKSTMIATALDGFGTPAVSVLSPANTRFYNPHLIDYPYDLARARALLTDAGYVDRDGDGVREDRAGRPVELTLTTNAGNPVREQIARVLQYDWQEGLHLRVHVDPVDAATLIDRLHTTFAWEVMLVGLTGSPEPHDADSFLRSSGALHVWYPRQPKPATDWEAEIDALLDRALAADYPTRRAAYWRIQQILHEHLPIIQTVRPLRFAAANSALQNFAPFVWGVYRPERLRFAP